MKFSRLVVFLLTLITGKSVIAQSIEGVWKGTSLCQVKNSPCHDEVVVYYISKDSTGKSYVMIANKIVDGKEDYMGTLNFTYNDRQKIFVCVDSLRNARWEFKLTGKVMKGNLMNNGALYRIIDVKREN